jgi:hypothetical protein
VVESPPKLEGKRLTVVLAPLPNATKVKSAAPAKEAGEPKKEETK